MSHPAESNVSLSLSHPCTHTHTLSLSLSFSPVILCRIRKTFLCRSSSNKQTNVVGFTNGSVSLLEEAEKEKERKNKLISDILKKNWRQASKHSIVVQTGFTTNKICLPSGCSTVVECTPHNKVVVGSILSRCWAFFSFYPQ